MVDRVWGGVEGGGTAFHCALARQGPSQPEILAQETIATTTPEATLAQVVAFFQRRHPVGPLAAVGAACFGPVDLDPASPTYGSITTTPKPGWAQTDVVGALRAALGIPVAWESDVNGALIAEQRWGAARGLDSAVYFTVGTGLGGGALVAGRPVHGLMHPEMGHIPLAALPTAPPRFEPGSCAYHGDSCLEGVASGLALERRAGRPLAQVPPDDPLWEEEARYLAHAAAVVTLTLSPQRIIFGGGVVLKQPHLYPRVRAHLLALLNGYLRSPTITDDPTTYITPPALGERAGLLGALALAMDAERHPL